MTMRTGTVARVAWPVAELVWLSALMWITGDLLRLTGNAAICRRLQIPWTIGVAGAAMLLAVSCLAAACWRPDAARRRHWIVGTWSVLLVFCLIVYGWFAMISRDIIAYVSDPPYPEFSTFMVTWLVLPILVSAVAFFVPGALRLRGWKAGVGALVVGGGLVAVLIWVSLGVAGATCGA
ncbi:MAG: hypothetical protein QM598_06480 [Protaetiibacter sp.]